MPFAVTGIGSARPAAATKPMAAWTLSSSAMARRRSCKRNIGAATESGSRWCESSIGVQHAMHADHAMFVALGRYTADAQAFAAKNGMTLVDGEQLLKIIRAGLDGAPLVLPETRHHCRRQAVPRARSVMVRRTAQRGALAGHDFWGCSRYPACRGTVNILDDAVAVD